MCLALGFRHPDDGLIRWNSRPATPPPTLGRPDAKIPMMNPAVPRRYTDGNIQLTIPRVASSVQPLMTTVASEQCLSATTDVATQTEPLPLPDQKHIVPWLHEWALRFGLHLALLSLFETLFFWRFVSVTEDSALTSLIGSYVTATVRQCAALTPAERAFVVAIFTDLVNTTTVAAEGQQAAVDRATWNGHLATNSWLYFGGLAGTVTLLSVARRRGVPWRSVVGENLALILFLGLYEWMFFATVVLKYRPVSAPELDAMVVAEFLDGC